MLKILNLETGYGKKQVLFGLSLEVKEGEIVSLIGPNGAGKSTVLKAVCGLIPVWSGEIFFNNVITNGSAAALNVSRGITFAPQGSRVFANLTVTENMEIGGFQLSRHELKNRVALMFNIFPLLKERARHEAGKLSGGEQQMLALARALVPKPKLLMLDEPSLGLSPNVVKTIFEKIIEINIQDSIGILIVEQKVKEVLSISNRVYSLKHGKVIYEGNPNSLKYNKELLRKLFL